MSNFLYAFWAAVIACVVYRVGESLSSITLPSYDPFSLKYVYEESVEAKAFLENSTYLTLQEAKLKPATNSYVSARFPKHEIQHDNIRLENATLLMLCRNWELPYVLQSMRSLEDRFNKDYHYPWVFLNDVEFTKEFIYETTLMASGKTYYDLVPPQDWNTPSYINQTKYDECRQEFIEKEVIYGGSKSYRNMCHFNSGYFFRQKRLLDYDYYFRVEPGIEYFCDFQMDPIRLMRENKKKYSFVITLYEYPETIPTLWSTVEGFLDEHPDYQDPNSAIDFITTKEPIGPKSVTVVTNSSYNLCHFWSNFEIGDLNFFRSQEYMDYFEYLSKAGGFYYERWGDAPVHSIAAAMLLDKDEVFNFEDIGYLHNPFYTYPDSLTMRAGKRCVVPPEMKGIDIQPHSCLPRWWRYGSGKRFTREYFHEKEYL